RDARRPDRRRRQRRSGQGVGHDEGPDEQDGFRCRPAARNAPMISEQQKSQYRTEGYFILDRVIPLQHLQLLRDAAQQVIEKSGQGSNRYVTEHNWREMPQLRRFLFSDVMADICRATIGPDAILFYEQFFIKCGETGKEFSWHQDSGYVGPNHKPYVTCWCALDDVSEANGTVYILPYSVSGIRTWVRHERDPDTKE